MYKSSFGLMNHQLLTLLEIIYTHFALRNLCPLSRLCLSPISNSVPVNTTCETYLIDMTTRLISLGTNNVLILSVDYCILHAMNECKAFWELSQGLQTNTNTGMCWPAVDKHLGAAPKQLKKGLFGASIIWRFLWVAWLDAKTEKMHSMERLAHTEDFTKAKL